MKVRHYNIPIFIPELACPHQCVFCNQEKISGTDEAPKPEEISGIIDTWLSTIDTEISHVELAFFGGSFTGIPVNLQEEYLKEVLPYIESGEIKGIRLSTRPDYINQDILDLLKKYGVTSIELGAQSLDKFVLKMAGRGHSTEDVKIAAKLINENGFELGLQMMLGLPFDTKEKSIYTAKKIIELGAKTTRIYPTLVIDGTALGKQYKEGTYKAICLEDAIDWTKDIIMLFEDAKVTVLRTGLHPSEEFEDDKSLLAGPYHPSFKEMVMTEVWKDKLSNLMTDENDLRIFVNPSQVNFAVGYKAKNKTELLKTHNSVKVFGDDNLDKFDFYVGDNR
ncbi:MAG: radical SAM protein [Flavobacteriales bacterium]|nr:radical SAM protein [Flavobacteriales bacterium]